MMMRFMSLRRLLLGGVLFGTLAAMSPAGAADAERGKTLFQPCSAYHNDRADALGPDLKGVFDRKAAARTDFRYSGPMTRANLTWDEANLKAYIADPQAKVKGNRMPYGGLTNAGDVDDVVAYLKILK
jgi:cytochrome c